MQQYKITPIMLRTIEAILQKRNRAEIAVENGKVVIIEVKRKLRETASPNIPEQIEYERR